LDLDLGFGAVAVAGEEGQVVHLCICEDAFREFATGASAPGAVDKRVEDLGCLDALA
jgi:hypothetical protein